MSGESKSDDQYNTLDKYPVNRQDESKEDTTLQKSNTTKTKEEKEILINPTDFQRLVDNFVDYASKGHLEKVKKLYESNPNILDMKRSNTGLTALHVCSEFGYDKVCKYLLDNKADVNTRSKLTGYTPLHLACSNGKLSIVLLLLQYGADKHVPDNRGEYAISVAEEYHQDDIADMLREPPLTPNPPELLSNTHNTIQIQWKLPNYNGSSVTDYEIYYGLNKNNLTPLHITKLTENQPGSFVDYTIKHLLPYTDYYITIRCHNRAGWSGFSKMVQLKSGTYHPNHPENIVVLNYTAISITIKWDNGKENGYPIESNIVQYKEITNDGLNQESEWIECKEVFEIDRCNIENLKPGKGYQFRVKVKNQEGWSDYSIESSVYYTYEAGTPREIGSDYIDIEWNIGNNNNHRSELRESDKDYDFVNVCSDIMMTSIGKDKDLPEEYEDWILIARHVKENHYLVKNLRPFTYYRFRIKPDNVTTDWDEIEKSDYIQTKPSLPDFPFGLSIASLYSRSVELIWSEPNDNGSPITEYLVEYEKNIILHSELCNIVIDHLKPGTEYKVNVYSRNSIGLSPKSPTLSFITNCDVPDQIINFKIIETTVSSIHFQWEEPCDNGYSIDNYIIEYLPMDSNDNNNNNNVSDWITMELEYYNTDYVLFNLDSGKEYKIRITAVNGLGKGIPYISKSIYTKSSVPGPVVAPTLENRTQNTLEISWNYPDDHGSIITQFELYIMKRSFEQEEYNPDSQFTIMVPNDKFISPMSNNNNSKENCLFSTVIDNLYPADIHIVRIRAYNKNGCGDYGSFSVEMITDPSIPNTPSILTISEIKARSLTLEWTVPRCNGYKINKYEINMLESNDGIWKLYRNRDTNTLYYKNLDTNEIASDLPTNALLLQPIGCTANHHLLNDKLPIIYDEIVKNNKVIYYNTVTGSIYPASSEDKSTQTTEENNNNRNNKNNNNKQNNNQNNNNNNYDHNTNLLQNRWYEIYDKDSGLMYYYNNLTMEVCWDKPRVSSTSSSCRSNNSNNSNNNGNNGNSNNYILYNPKIHKNIEIPPAPLTYVPGIEWQNIATITNPTKSYYNVINLKPNNYYQFRLCCYNKLGKSDYIYSNTIKTQKDIPDPPTSFIVKVIDGKTIYCTWSASKDNGSKIKEYILEYKPLQFTQMITTSSLKTNNITSLSSVHKDKMNKWYAITNIKSLNYTVQNLYPCCEYLFRIKSKNEFGESIYKCNLDIYTTPAGVPGLMSNPKLIEKTDTTATIEWTRPVDNGSPISNYDLRYRAEFENNTYDWKYCEKIIDTVVTLCELVPESTYTIQIRANNNAGHGPWSQSQFSI